jgi:peptidoglycan-associated lipoprotein
MNATKISTLFLAFAFAVLVTGCHHHPPVAKTQPTTPTITPAAPVASITATPPTVDRGQTVQLSWNTQNAKTITIEGVGTVAASGSKTVTPASSTTYVLSARGDGGSTEASARVTVNVPDTRAEITDEQLFAQNVKDIFFSYDNYQILADQKAALDADAEFLAKHPGINLVIEGHCDERGSEEYNMGLGENRASIVKSVLKDHGVSPDRVKVISLGKEQPFCTKSEDESCWKQNRRAHFVFGKKQMASNQ